MDDYVHDFVGVHIKINTSILTLDDNRVYIYFVMIGITCVCDSPASVG